MGGWGGLRSPDQPSSCLHLSHPNPIFDTATNPLRPHHRESHAQHAVGCQNSEGQCTNRGGDQHYSIHKVRHGSRFPHFTRGRERARRAPRSWLEAFSRKNPLEQLSQMFSKSMRLCVLTIGIPVRSRRTLPSKTFRNRTAETPPEALAPASDPSRPVRPEHRPRPPKLFGFTLIGDNRSNGRSRLTPSQVIRSTLHVRTAHCPEGPVSSCH